MAKIANRRFQVEDGQKARIFEVGEEVPDEYVDRYDPKLVDEGAAVSADPNPEGSGGAGSAGGGELPADLVEEFEGLKTIEQITTWVRMGGPDARKRAGYALAVETGEGGGQRKGLIEALDAVLAGDEG